jgi:hypothetical protein
LTLDSGPALFLLLTTCTVAFNKINLYCETKLYFFNKLSQLS